MELIFLIKEKSKTNESHNFVLNLSQRLDNKIIALQNLSILYTWKIIRNEYKNNKLVIIAPK